MSTICVPEPTFAAGGQQLLRDLASLVGVPFAGTRLGEHRKSVVPAFANPFLGVQHDFTPFERLRLSYAGVSESLVEKLGLSLGSIIEKRSFAGSAGPLKLAGQLQFSLSWCARRFGRAATQPIHRAGRAMGRHETLDKVTVEARSGSYEICWSTQCQRGRVCGRALSSTGARKSRTP